MGVKVTFYTAFPNARRCWNNVTLL